VGREIEEEALKSIETYWEDRVTHLQKLQGTTRGKFTRSPNNNSYIRNKMWDADASKVGKIADHAGAGQRGSALRSE